MKFTSEEEMIRYVSAHPELNWTGDEFEIVPDEKAEAAPAAPQTEQEAAPAVAQFEPPKIKYGENTAAHRRRVAAAKAEWDAAHPEKAPVAEAVARAESETAVPTKGQKEAGNYKKGRFTVHGMEIAIENPVGSVRTGVTRDGKPWRTEMKNTYGYFAGESDGKDGDKLDVFLGPDVEGAPMVYVIDQVDPASGTFDEHKVMLGFPSEVAARAAYLANYQAGWKGLKTLTGVPVEAFKAWMASSDRKLKPFAEYSLVKKEQPSVPAQGDKTPAVGHGGGEKASPSEKHLGYAMVAAGVTPEDFEATLRAFVDRRAKAVGAGEGTTIRRIKVVKGDDAWMKYTNPVVNVLYDNLNLYVPVEQVETWNDVALAQDRRDLVLNRWRRKPPSCRR
jgi:hypothetical protein